MFSKKNRIYWLLAMGLIVVWLSVYGYLNQRTQSAMDSRLKERTATQKVAWQAAVNTYTHSIQTYYHQLVNRQEIWQAMRQAQQPQYREQARAQLIEQLQPVYRYLKSLGIRQFHFHTPDNHSFIRFHYLEKWGDDLTDVRPSIRWTNENKQAYFGFETGRVVSGFRHVFPIIDDSGTHLGSVELSLPFEQIRLEAAELLPDRNFRMVIAENDLLSKLFESQRSIYSPWPVNPGFYIEDRHGTLEDSAPALNELERQIGEQLKIHPTVQDWLNTGQEGSVAIFLDKLPYSVTLTPIYDTLDQLSGYFIGYRLAPEVTMSLNNFKTSLWVNSLVVLLIGLLVVLWIRRKHQHQQEREFLKTIYDTMGEGLYVVDAHGAVRHVNRKALQVLGFKEHELLGHQAHGLFHSHPIDYEHAITECPIQAKVFKGETFEGVVKFKTKSNELLTVKVVSQPLTHHGVFKGAVTTFMDISHEQQVADELKRAKDQAEMANRAKSDFLANMSHEIRTPLNAVIGLGELMHDTPLNTQQSDYLNKINQSAKLLLSILNDILDYSKIEAGKLVLSPEDFEFQEVFDHLENLFQQQAHKKGLGFILDIDPNIPSTLHGDEMRLMQILTNLTSNAIKFTPKGQVQISAKWVKQHEQQVEIAFSVCDTGIGMTPEQLAKLFRPFVQADTSTTRKFGGTGLGLVISQRLIEALNGGVLQASSQLGQGTCFSFNLVFEVVDQPVHSEPLPMTTDHQTWLSHKFVGHVLLAEDNEINQMVAMQLLQKAGLKVSVVPDGQEALKAAQNQKFDAIFMDLQMPIMSGYEATLAIRQFDQDTPIIALTAAALVEDREKALQCGMNDHLGKPIEIPKLYAALLKWLSASETQQVSEKHKANDSILPNKIDGIDLVLGLQKLEQNQVLYRQLLEQFAVQVAQENQNLRLELSPKHLQSIKGVSGNLGAMALYQAADQLENCLKLTHSDQALTRAKQVFFEQLDRIHVSLNNWLQHDTPLGASNQEKTSSDSTLDDTVRLDLLKKLQQGDLLNEQDSKKLVHWFEAKVDDSQRQMQLKQALLTLDYKTAYQLVSDALR